MILLSTAVIFITPAVKVLLKQYATPAYKMEETLMFMGNILAQTVCTDSYLTAAALLLNRRSLKAEYTCAGHPPIVYIPDEGACRLLESRNPPIGIGEEMTYHTESMDVFHGDKFILFTDGLVELPDKTSGKTQAWTDGVGALLGHAEKIRKLPLEEIPEALLKSTAGSAKADDDIAILVVSV